VLPAPAEVVNTTLPSAKLLGAIQQPCMLYERSSAVARHGSGYDVHTRHAVCRLEPQRRANAWF